jgi:hypothetical protein
VPSAGNPTAWNRYSYVFFNPLKLTDPSGNIPISDDVDPSLYYEDENEKGVDLRDSMSEEENKGEISNSGVCPTEFPECQIIYYQEGVEEDALWDMIDTLQWMEYMLWILAADLGGLGALTLPTGVGFFLAGTAVGVAYETERIQNFRDYLTDVANEANDNGGQINITIFYKDDDEINSLFPVIWAGKSSNDNMNYAYLADSALTSLILRGLAGDN